MSYPHDEKRSFYAIGFDQSDVRPNPRSRKAAMRSHQAFVERSPMNRFVIALVAMLVLAFVNVSRAQYGCGFGAYTPGHTHGPYDMSGCCSFCSCPGPFGNVAPSFPPAPGPSTLTPPGPIPPTPIYYAPAPTLTPSPSPPPATTNEPSSPAAPGPTTPPPSNSTDRGLLRVMISQTPLN